MILVDPWVAAVRGEHTGQYLLSRYSPHTCVHYNRFEMQVLRHEIANIKLDELTECNTANIFYKMHTLLPLLKRKHQQRGIIGVAVAVAAFVLVTLHRKSTWFKASRVTAAVPYTPIFTPPFLPAPPFHYFNGRTAHLGTIPDFSDAPAAWVRDHRLFDSHAVKDCLSEQRVWLLGDSTMAETAHDLVALLSGQGGNLSFVNWYTHHSTRMPLRGGVTELAFASALPAVGRVTVRFQPQKSDH